MSSIVWLLQHWPLVLLGLVGALEIDHFPGICPRTKKTVFVVVAEQCVRQFLVVVVVGAPTVTAGRERTTLDHLQSVK